MLVRFPAHAKRTDVACLPTNGIDSSCASEQEVRRTWSVASVEMPEGDFAVEGDVMKRRVGVVRVLGAVGIAIALAVGWRAGGKTSAVFKAPSTYTSSHSMFIVPVPAWHFHMLR